MYMHRLIAVGLLCLVLLAACSSGAPAADEALPTMTPLPVAPVAAAAASSEDAAAPAQTAAEVGSAAMTETQALSATLGENAMSVTTSDAITPPVDAGVVTSDGTVSSAPAGAAGGAAGSADPGAGANDSPAEAPPSAAVLSGEVMSYASTNYGFEIVYPGEYVFSEVAAGALNQLIPVPVAGFSIMNPTLAASDVAELELPDLQIRVFPTSGAASLDAWLAAAGRTPPDYEAAQPFQAAQVSGVRVCHTMLVPGCSHFIMGDAWVYELVPGSQIGEVLVDRFALLQ